MLYRLKLELLKTASGQRAWSRWRARRGDEIGSDDGLFPVVQQYAPGMRFVDIGCMWGVDGAYSFIAEEAGARRVVGVDVFGPTPEFERELRARSSAVEFVLGDATEKATLERVGNVDVVLCAGVLYHHPSPFDLLVALRRMCGRTLILRTATIPEMPLVRNAAVYYPMLRARDRRQWELSRSGLTGQVGISTDFKPGEGYGNWFWGMTPSCVAALLETAGFAVQRRIRQPFAQTFVAVPVDSPFEHRLPTESQARAMGAQVSATPPRRSGH